jgi:hypothetical protein
LSNLTEFSVVGVYNITTIYDGNENYTGNYETFYVNVTEIPDTTPPNITIVYPANNTNSTDYGLNVNFTVSDNIAVDECWWSDDYGATNISNPTCLNLTGPWVDGLNTVWVWVNDTSGNEARDEVTFRIDTTPPYFTSIVDQTIPETDPLSYTPTASDDGVGFGYWEINATEMIVINSGTGEITNISALSPGYYSYNITINDTLGNTNSTIWHLNITSVDSTNPSVSGLTETPVDGSQYSPGQIYEFNATITDDNLDTVLIEFDGINYTPSNLAGDVYNFTITDLAVGSYSYTWYANDTSGNINSSESGTYDVVQNSSYVLSINLSPSDTEVFGTETTATGSGCPSQLVCNLSINGSFVSNPDVQTLGAGVWNYTYNSTGNSNYTSKSISDLLTITQASSEVYTYLNNSRANITIYSGESIWLNGTLNTGSGNIYLYNNGTLINSGASPLANLTTFITVGIYNITTIYESTQNYSSSFETFYVNVTSALDTTPPYFTTIPANATLTYGQDWAGVYFNANDETGFGSFFIDDTTNFTINSTGFLDNNTFLFVGVYIINVSINDTSGNINYTMYQVTVGKATPTGNLNSNATWTIAPGDSVEINFTETNEGDADVNYTVYRDGVYIGTGETWTPIPGTYTYVLNTTGGQNYSANANIDTQVLTVTTAGIPSIAFTNGTEANNSFVRRNWIFANVSVTIILENTITFRLYNSSHTLINSSSFTDSRRTINWTNLTDGRYYYNVTVNNSGGGTNSTETRWITLDNEYGNISILIPTEGYAYNNVVTSINVDVNYSVNETNLNSCWYRLRGVQTIENTSTPCSNGYNNFTMTISNFGYLTLDVFSNDSASNQEYDFVNFYVNQYTGPQQGGGSNTNPGDEDEEDVENSYNATILCQKVNEFLKVHENYTYEEKESLRNSLSVTFGFAIDDQLLNKYLNNFKLYCPEYNVTIPENPIIPEEKHNYTMFWVLVAFLVVLILVLIIMYDKERLVLILNWLKRKEDEEKKRKS